MLGAPSVDNLLVFYVPGERPWRDAIDRMRAAGYEPVPSFNPSWDRVGRTFEDPDVLSCGVAECGVVGLILARLAAVPHQVERMMMVNVALLANAEPATTVWFAFRIGPSTFGVFDAFSDDAGRQAYLAGQIAAALMVKAPELLAPAADHRASRRARREAAIERVDGRHRQMLASRSTHH